MSSQCCQKKTRRQINYTIRLTHDDIKLKGNFGKEKRQMNTLVGGFSFQSGKKTTTKKHVPLSFFCEFASTLSKKITMKKVLLTAITQQP